MAAQQPQRAQNPEGMGGVDDRGQAMHASSTGNQRPVINPSPSVTKRYLDANSDHPAAKRVSFSLPN
jgi:hypothetical protein